MGSQEPIKHYYEGYDTLTRFVSYYYQTKLVKDLKPSTVLEIGVGNKTVTNYLTQNGHSVKTCDVNPSLQPDIVCDIRELDVKGFDAVIAYEVLEHLPFDDVGKALANLAKASKKYVIISVPYCSLYLDVVFKVPFRHCFDLFLRLPLPLKINPLGQHQWEIGRRGYPLRKVRALLQEHFIIKQEIRSIIDAGKYYFVMEKNGN